LPGAPANSHVGAIQKLLTEWAHAPREIPPNAPVNGVYHIRQTNVHVADLPRRGVNAAVCKNLLHALYPIGAHQTVAIQPANNIAAGFVKAAVTGMYQALPGLGHKSHKRIS